MKKRLLIILFLFFSLITVLGCTKKEINEDALKFKEDYESLNGTLNSSGKEYRSVLIDEDNPFVYISAEKLVEKLEKGESFYVYFGDKMCPWCRSVIEEFINVSKKQGIGTVYYVDIWDDEHVEILRDKYEINDNNEVVLVSEGDASYKKILEHFDSVLSDYTLTNNANEKVNVGEKRIYAPNFIYVRNGKAVRMVEGISDKQKSANDKLTDDIINDERKSFETLFEIEGSCNNHC